MKNRIIKLIGSIFSVETITSLLFWAITKKHNLRESWIGECDICDHYFLLIKALSAKGIISHPSEYVVGGPTVKSWISNISNYVTKIGLHSGISFTKSLGKVVITDSNGWKIIIKDSEYQNFVTGAAEAFVRFDKKFENADWVVTMSIDQREK